MGNTYEGKRMRLLSIGVLLVALLGCGHDYADHVTPAGGAESEGANELWGNESETLEVSGDQLSFEGVCVSGSGAVRQRERSGGFEGAGTLRRHGGARRDPQLAQQEVVFRGTITDGAMKLTISTPEGTELSDSTLRRGVRGTARPCA